MPRTRRQTTAAQSPIVEREPLKREETEGQEGKLDDSSSARRKRTKRKIETETKQETDEKPSPKKKVKTEIRDYLTGVIERGHIYFFYRPKVEHETAKSLDEVRNMHMLLVPRPPKFSVQQPRDDNKGSDITNRAKKEEGEGISKEMEMELLAPGADAIPAPETLDDSKKHYRLLTIGKKHLPDPQVGGAGKGRKETFWATVSAVGDDLHNLEKVLGEKTYETKTRGTRHEAPARLAARGVYALVNNEPTVPSKRATHFGYHISHPSPSELGSVQEELGIGEAASFVMQVKNPLAPAMAPQQAHTKGAEYPEEILTGVFGKGGGKKGREKYGLRFATCETPELLDYERAEVLLIAARGGEEGLETSFGEGRGKALSEYAEKESKEAVETLFRELNADVGEFPSEPLTGEWI